MNYVSLQHETINLDRLYQQVVAPSCGAVTSFIGSLRFFSHWKHLDYHNLLCVIIFIIFFRHYERSFWRPSSISSFIWSVWINGIERASSSLRWNTTTIFWHRTDSYLSSFRVSIDLNLIKLIICLFRFSSSHCCSVVLIKKRLTRVFFIIFFLSLQRRAY